jgi:hypothetical protein
MRVQEGGTVCRHGGIDGKTGESSIQYNTLEMGSRKREVEVTSGACTQCAFFGRKLAMVVAEAQGIV